MLDVRKHESKDTTQEIKGRQKHPSIIHRTWWYAGGVVIGRVGRRTGWCAGRVVGGPGRPRAGGANSHETWSKSRAWPNHSRTSSCTAWAGGGAGGGWGGWGPELLFAVPLWLRPVAGGANRATTSPSSPASPSAASAAERHHRQRRQRRRDPRPGEAISPETVSKNRAQSSHSRTPSCTEWAGGAGGWGAGTIIRCTAFPHPSASPCGRGRGRGLDLGGGLAE